MSVEEKVVQKAAKKLALFRLIKKYTERESANIEANIEAIISNKMIRGVSLQPGREVCKPDWKEEFRNLCAQFKLNPDVEEEKVKTRVGIKKEKNQVIVDASLIPTNEEFEIVTHYLNGVKL